MYRGSILFGLRKCLMLYFGGRIFHLVVTVTAIHQGRPPVPRLECEEAGLPSMELPLLLFVMIGG